MNASELVVFITSVSIIVAEQFPDNDDLGLLAAALTQVGDTLATIATQRGLLEGGIAPEQSSPSP